MDKLIGEFRSWSWNFGKTPKFTITEMLEVTDHDGKAHCLNLHLEVQHGIVEEVGMDSSNELALTDFNQDANTITSFRGTRYNHEIIENIIAAISCKTVPLKTIQTNDKSNVIVTQ